MKNLKYIKDWDLFNENYTTGIFGINLDGEYLVFNLYVQKTGENITNVYLLLDGNIYDELSIETPDSSNLNDEEFFLNPNIDERIVRELVKQNFITKTDNETTAGDKETYSYQL